MEAQKKTICNQQNCSCTNCDCQTGATFEQLKFQCCKCNFTCNPKECCKDTCGTVTDKNKCLCCDKGCECVTCACCFEQECKCPTSDETEYKLGEQFNIPIQIPQTNDAFEQTIEKTLDTSNIKDYLLLNVQNLIVGPITYKIKIKDNQLNDIVVSNDNIYTQNILKLSKDEVISDQYCGNTEQNCSIQIIIQANKQSLNQETFGTTFMFTTVDHSSDKIVEYSSLNILEETISQGFFIEPIPHEDGEEDLNKIIYIQISAYLQKEEKIIINAMTNKFKSDLKFLVTYNDLTYTELMDIFSTTPLEEMQIVQTPFLECDDPEQNSCIKSLHLYLYDDNPESRNNPIIDSFFLQKFDVNEPTIHQHVILKNEQAKMLNSHTIPHQNKVIFNYCVESEELDNLFAEFSFYPVPNFLNQAQNQVQNNAANEQVHLYGMYLITYNNEIIGQFYNSDQFNNLDVLKTTTFDKDLLITYFSYASTRQNFDIEFLTHNTNPRLKIYKPDLSVHFDYSNYYFYIFYPIEQNDNDKLLYYNATLDIQGLSDSYESNQLEVQIDQSHTQQNILFPTSNDDVIQVAKNSTQQIQDYKVRKDATYILMKLVFDQDIVQENPETIKIDLKVVETLQKEEKIIPKGHSFNLAYLIGIIVVVLIGIVVGISCCLRKKKEKSESRQTDEYTAMSTDNP